RVGGTGVTFASRAGAPPRPPCANATPASEIRRKSLVFIGNTPAAHDIVWLAAGQIRGGGKTPSNSQGGHVEGTGTGVHAPSQDRPQTRGVSAIVAAGDRLVDLAPVFHHALDFGLRLYPRVCFVELAPQPVGRPVEIVERLIEGVLLRARVVLLAVGCLALA